MAKLKMSITPEKNMKDVLYKNLTSIPKGKKTILIREKSEDQECLTYIRKSFIYLATNEVRINQPADAPQIFIKKLFNSKTKEEKFSFKVKGFFYITKDFSFVKVRFSHTLKINIHWKTKVLSPKAAELK